MNSGEEPKVGLVNPEGDVGLVRGSSFTQTHLPLSEGPA